MMIFILQLNLRMMQWLFWRRDLSGRIIRILLESEETWTIQTLSILTCWWIFPTIRVWKILKRHTKKLIKIWNLFRKKELMRYHTLQMQQEFFTTRKCSKNMDGKYQLHGMNSWACVRRYRMQESSHFILDLKIHGLVLHRGMRLR